jgi:hypothetical protein
MLYLMSAPRFGSQSTPKQKSPERGLCQEDNEYLKPPQSNEVCVAAFLFNDGAN